MGTNKIEGTFTNALVSVDTTLDEMNSAKESDVIRIELTEDGTLTSATIESLHDTSAYVSVDADGNITLAKSAFYQVSAGGTIIDGDATADAVISLSANKANLKAGDVITITLGEATLTKAAEPGEDALRLQIGANAGQEVALGINAMTTEKLDICDKSTGEGLDVTTQSGASMAIEAYDMAIQKVSTERAKLGAMQNRLEHSIANLDTSAENLQAAESSLRDTDMAEEMTEYSKNNILMQAGQSMLAQANQSNQGVLGLLQQ